MKTQAYQAQLAPSMWLRQEWGAEEPYRRVAPLGKVRYITVHHTVSRRALPLDEVRSIQAYHMTKEPDPFYDIGYHFMVDRGEYIDGKDIYEGRKPQPDGGLSIGAHVAGNNEGNIGVAVLGNYQEAEPAPEQLHVLEQLLAWLCYTYGLNVEDIRAHRDFSPTVCPGDALYRVLPEIRARVDARLRGHSADLRLVINGVDTRLDPPLFIKEGRAFAPVRGLAEALGFRVSWDAATRTVYINSAPARPG